MGKEIKIENPNILVVDDKKQNLLAIKKLLEKFDANIITANNGNEALQQVLKNEFALILMDVQMPVMDGFEAARIMRTEIKTPIIFLSAVSTEKDLVLKGYEMGAVDYLVKPIEPEILKGKVEVFLCLYDQKVRLEKYKNSLEQMVEDRTIELKRTYDQLMHAEKLNAVGKLVASIAHEFNNPIFGILNVLQMVKDKLTIKNELTEFVDLAICECNRMSNLIRRLKDFQRLPKVTLESANIHEVIDDTLFLFHKKFKDRNIILTKNYVPEMPTLKIVTDQIKQVILNLLGNAEEAITNENGGEIKIATEVLNTTIMIIVSDTGEGIKEEEMLNIFEPFFTTKSGKGTGLGLSISYNIIKQHGGDIRVESKPGASTKFTIELPLNNLK